ncbi:sensor histidine kinase [Micromonospora parathelypteridis]|uniref:histidine kinase n=1 Tax=Micromonospora parathelypteridis TaxID=1839617 RepID=A0A840VQ00_9ACTN|nr:sensor histidine kinase [Micromonospora parathelypteridis]MBB5479122.1 signal transduction histidine kinase [Micromonospora parathelypteridis]GGO02924.1 histidine kinase [Micromonospora parathelypteridis]
MTRLRQLRNRVGYVLASLPLAVAGFAYAGLTVVVGGLSSLTLLGLPLMSSGVLGARGWGRLHRALARATLGLRVDDPRPVRRRPGPVGYVRTGLGDATGWRALAYLIIKLPVTLLAAAVTAAFLCYPVFLLSHPLWWKFVQPVNTDSLGRPHRAALQLGDFFFDTWPRSFLLAGIGAAMLLVGPWLLRLVLLLDELLIRGLLGPTSLDTLQQTRALAVDDAAALLRRIERDLHDGTQAQLVALAMKLGMVKEKLADGSAPEARALVETAHRDAKTAITDLRDLARGIHPPMLDNGLEAALATLVARGAVPVVLRVELSERPSPAVETIAYYCVAELLTNVAKHGRARRATVEVRQHDGLLRVQVRDDGGGGAMIGSAGSALPGGGLAGLRDRARTVDGTMRIDSPPGGPTLVTVELPVRP